MLYRNSDTEIPAITLCPSYDAAYKRNILAKYNWSADSMREMKTPETNLSTLEFWHLVTHSLRDIVNSVTIEVTSEIPNTSITEISMFENIQGLSNHSSYEMIKSIDVKDWTTCAWPAFGFCYVFKTPEEIARLGVYSISLNLKIKTYIYMHHYNQFYHVEQNKIVATPGKRSYLSFFYDLTKLLQESKGSLCSDEMNDSHDSCILDNLDKAMKDKFGCSFVNTSYPESICNGRNVKESYKDDFNGEFFKLYRTVLTTFCPKPCKTMDVFYGIPVESDNNIKEEAFTKLYFKQQINSRRSTYSYESDSVIADIGGYLGLLLGFSLLDITIIIEQLLSGFDRRRNTN